MQRISVDLPEPDGPAMTIRSPRITLRLMSRNTWKSPYHLCMPTTSIATSVSDTLMLEVSIARSTVAEDTWLIGLPLVAGVEASLHPERVARHGETENPEHGCSEDIACHRLRRRSPVDVGTGRLHRVQQVEDAHDGHQRRVLEQGDEVVHDARDHVPQRLWQDDEPG